MKRDCGKGELIPVKWTVVSTFGMSDDETEKTFKTKEDAEREFNHIEATLIACSDVRLYAEDKQGYANCIKMTIITLQGKINKTDRTNEL